MDKYRIAEEIGEVTKITKYYIEYKTGLIWKKWKRLQKHQGPRRYPIFVDREFGTKKAAQAFINYHTELISTKYYYLEEEVK